MPSLRKRLGLRAPTLVAGAHNALSAKLVEEAGFDAVWASSFEMSVARCVPDASILTFRDTAEAVRQMVDAVSLPVIVDCDAGFGNAVNVVRAVRELERAGAGGVCIEDNSFPKRCSLYSDVRRELADADEHAGKIRAAVATRADPEFIVIARTEALIAGWGIEEALARARAYADSEADLILAHSKSADLSELVAFAQRWDRPVPLVAVPTTYKHASADELYALGYAVVIFANHALRASVRAMQSTLARLRSEQRPSAVDAEVATLDEVDRIVGVADLRAQERRYLPARTGRP